MVQSAKAATLEIRAERTRIALMDVAGQMAASQLTDAFDGIRDTAEDLKIIEAATRAKFRYPRELHVEERIMIRNLRLMLEGHCVAHPTHTRFTARLNGTWDDSLDSILTTEYRWVMHRQAQGELKILGQTILLPALGQAALVHLDQADVDDIRAAFAAGTAAGRVLSFRVRPGDRLRMFLPDRFPTDRPLDVTPWGIDGINQKGLGPDGDPLP